MDTAGNQPGSTVEAAKSQDMPKPKYYRFGSVAFSLDEIQACGERHGVDGVRYYPPSMWGASPSVDAMTAYDKGFKAGRSKRKQYGMKDLEHFTSDPKL